MAVVLARLQRPAGGLMMAREAERTTIAREIHDVLGQALTALKIDRAWIGSRVPGDTAAVRVKLAGRSAPIDEAVMSALRISSAPGAGTTVRVQIPRREAGA